jgi:HEPN domain
VNARDLMEKASRAVVSASLLLDAGDVERACNRAYYAMFDAARAALIQSGACAGRCQDARRTDLDVQPAPRQDRTGSNRVWQGVEQGGGDPSDRRLHRGRSDRPDGAMGGEQPVVFVERLCGASLRPLNRTKASTLAQNRNYTSRGFR